MIGTIVGAVTDNIGIWLPVGIAIGVALETTQKNKKNPLIKGVNDKIPLAKVLYFNSEILRSQQSTLIVQ